MFLPLPLLRSGLAFVLGISFLACGGGGTNNASTLATAAPTPIATATPTPTATTTPTPTPTPTPIPTPTPTPNGLIPLKSAFVPFGMCISGLTVAEQISVCQTRGYAGLGVATTDATELKAFADHAEVASGRFKIVSTLWFANARETLDTAKLQWLDGMLTQLARMHAALWMVVDANDQSAATITAAVDTFKVVAARCKAKGVQLVIYPHGGCAIDSAEGAVAILPRIGDPDVKVSVHLCHELMKGNRDRMGQVVANVASHLALASVNGADYDAQDHPNDNWASAIQPLDQGTYDPRVFLQALADAGYRGPMELHTYNLPDPRVNDHFTRSLNRWRQLVDPTP